MGGSLDTPVNPTKGARVSAGAATRGTQGALGTSHNIRNRRAHRPGLGCSGFNHYCAAFVCGWRGLLGLPGPTNGQARFISYGPRGGFGPTMLIN
jgi:hypothetical protein